MTLQFGTGENGFNDTSYKTVLFSEYPPLPLSLLLRGSSPRRLPLSPQVKDRGRCGRGYTETS